MGIFPWLSPWGFLLEPRGGARELIDPQHAPAPEAAEAPEPAGLVEENHVQGSTPHLGSSGGASASDDFRFVVIFLMMTLI